MFPYSLNIIKVSVLPYLFVDFILPVKDSRRFSRDKTLNNVKPHKYKYTYIHIS